MLTKEDQDAVFNMGQRTTGSSTQTTHFITSYTSYDEHGMMSYEVDRAALHILDSALVSNEQFIQLSKQQEKIQLEREIMTGGKVTSSLYFPEGEGGFNPSAR